MTGTKRKSHYGVYSGCLLGLLVILHVPPVKDALSLSQLILPAIWTVLALIIVCVLPCVDVPGRLSLRSYIRGYAFSGAIIFLSLSFLLGVFLGKLSATPYDISPRGILYNLAGLVPAFAARELIRAYALGTIYRTKRRPFLKTALLTALLALAEINFDKLLALKDTASIFIYAAKDAAPVILKSMVLTMLVYYGGAGPGIIYSLGIAVFQRVFPFLPALPWLADSALGITFPVLFSFFLTEKYRALTGTAAETDEGNIAVYGLGLLGTVLFAWFVAGVFPIYPSVVLTGSMEPGIMPGDVILVERAAEETDIYRLKAGDIINFKRDNITITHRILEVRTDEAGNVSFETKGDNNPSPDAEIVHPNDVNGTVTRVIPKAGIPVLILKSGDPVPEGVTEE